MSPDITRYLTATEGSVRGAAWCAYFVSYITRRAGVPIGDGGSGLGYVGDITAWGQSVQRYFPSGSTRYRPQPGDIILWNPNHIGLVVQNRGSSVVTIEGNASDRVNRLTRSVASATGFIRLAGPRLGRSDGASGGGANLGNIL